MKLKSLLFGCAMTLCCFATFAVASNPNLSGNSLSANLPGSFTGLSWELVASDAVPGYDTYRVYANFSNSGDQLTAIFGQDVTPLTISTTGTFYQDANGGALSSDVNPAFFGAFPSLEYDSWVTIGADAGVSALSSLGVDYSSFEGGSTLTIADPIGGAWFVLPDSEPAAFPDGMGRVLIAQLTTDGFVSMTLNVQYRAVDTSNPQEVGLSLNFPPVVNGCTNPAACNFNPAANVDDGSCNLPDGCTNPVACNYNNAALCDDGSCILPDGCTNPVACNYNNAALCDDGSCILPDGCTNPVACNYNNAALCDDGSCILPDGCTNPVACNYNNAALCDDGSCILPDGCTNPVACNYNNAALCDDGSCILPDGCTNPLACNYNNAALCDDGSCILPDGCTNPLACNYNNAALCDDGSCEFISCLPGCTYPLADNYNASAASDDGSCIFSGCTNPAASNFSPIANNDDGSCVIDVLGCTYATANNYNAAATVDDGLCDFPVVSGTCPADLNGDNVVNTGDLNALLSVYGTVCP